MNKVQALAITVILFTLLMGVVVSCRQQPAPVPTPEPQTTTPAPESQPEPQVEPSPEPEPPLAPPSETITPKEPERKITLDDAPAVLDLSSDLPASFERLDPAEEGMSNKDMGLGPDFSEVELYLCEDPFQMVFCFMGVITNKIELAATRSEIKDDDKMRSAVLWGLEEGSIEEGIEFEDPEIHISNPDIGDLAVLASGELEAYGSTMGLDMLMFLNGQVLITISQTYHGTSIDLIPLAEIMSQRIEAFKH